ncbi:hypothetical protein TSAR_013502 [Trichomalopsis sarcophagae]|uniref:Uncharacterized protein n=1 Tax=Trichomalopsis sarcophagae TaxID=543379 RepID=A0A232EYA6_9HYME|nr:hypothetical protein TSAR_013502 [Trichomalopsis sarcophagae]
MTRMLNKRKAMSPSQVEEQQENYAKRKINKLHS